MLRRTSDQRNGTTLIVNVARLMVFFPQKLSQDHGFSPVNSQRFSGTNGAIVPPCAAPLADVRPYYSDCTQPACALSQSLSQNGGPGGTAPPRGYHPWFMQEQTCPHATPAFPPYFGPHGASAIVPPSTGALLFFNTGGRSQQRTFSRRESVVPSLK